MTDTSANAWVSSTHRPMGFREFVAIVAAIMALNPLAMDLMLPGLPDVALVPGYAGMRPKLQAPGEDARDFLIQGPADHGVPGLVNLFGIESPGLTSSLAIGTQVAALVQGSAG